MNRVLRSALYLSTALSLGAAVPATAWAQADNNAETASPQEIEQVVVTATRREERLQDVPISISVFNQEQLTNRNVVNASDLAAYTPSLSTDTRFGTDNSSFSIRGFTQEIRTAPSVGVYFSDVVEPRGGGHGTPAGDGAGPGDFFDLQNVQVLKGPQGTLFGRNTTGGAILIVPQKPTPDFGGYIEGSYGNYNMKRIQGVINIPLNDTMRLRIGVDHQTRDGYLKNTSGVGPSRFADVDYTAGRVSFVWDVTPDIENYTIARFSRSEHVGPLAQVYAYNADAIANVNFADLATVLPAVLANLAKAQVIRQNNQDFWTVQNSMPNPKVLVQQWQVINKTTWQATDNLTVKNIISYAQYQGIQRGSIFGDAFVIPNTITLGSLVLPAPNPGTPFTMTNSNPPPGHWTNDQSTFTEELQVQGRSFGDRLIWQAGLYMELSDPLSITGSLSSNFSYCTDQNNHQCFDPLGFGGGEQQTLGTTRYRDYAVYGQATYNITDQVKFTGGFRYTYDHTDGMAQQILYNFPTPNNYVPSCPVASGLVYNPADPRTCTLTNSQTSRAPTGVAELQYTPASNMMFYAKYARGYRQGSVSPDSPVGYQKFDPEHVNTYEIGAKTSWDWAMPTVFDFAAFYNDFSNQQLQVGFQNAAAFGNLAAAPTTGIVNAGQSRIWGVEIDSSVSPFKDFTVNVSWSYLDSKLVSETFPPDPQGFQPLFTSLPGYPLPLTPKNKVSLTGTYTLPIPRAYGKLMLSATYVHSTKQLTSTYASTFAPYTSDVDLLNMNLNWLSIGGGQIDGSLFVTNLTDNKYVTFVTGLYNGYGFETRSVGEPRMFGIRLRYNFGD